MYHAATCRYLIRVRLARASRTPWYKWNFFETLSLICFSMPLSRSVSLSLPPPAPHSLCLHVSHPSSPSAHPIIKSFSSCFPKSHAPLLSRTSSSLASFFIPLLLQISFVETRGPVEKALLLVDNTGQGFVYSPLLYTLTPLLRGHRTKLIVTRCIFLHKSHLEMKEGDSPLIYAMLSLTLGFVM